MAQNNFLIGRGELLTHPIAPPPKVPRTKEVYSLSEARQRLRSQIDQAVQIFDELPQEACPGDFVVARLALNPSFIAKSFFPVALLRATNLVSIGSRNIDIEPEKWSRKAPVSKCSTTELFVAGKRASFRAMPVLAETFQAGTDEALQYARIEKFSSYLPEERVKGFGRPKNEYFEVGLHLLSSGEDELYVGKFRQYAENLGIGLYPDLEFSAGALWFTPIKASREQVTELAKYAFVRVIRPVPRLRAFRPVTRAPGVSLTCDLPNDPPVSTEPRVAVLDGGLPKKHPISPWVKSYKKSDDLAADIQGGTSHGLAVSSAVLFGSITPGSEAARPYCAIDHYRILDKESDKEPALEMYRTLGFIEEILLSRQYEFINLSLGPDLPIEDTDVHAWTSVIDDYLSDGETFMTIAVGNNGEMDKASGNARVQVPADCVNAVSVGAADRTDDSWCRAGYSAIGPGRSPGVIKPDLMAFGGSTSAYFHVFQHGALPSLVPNLGTSFASPCLLREAIGVRAVLGRDVSPLTIKALLVHAASSNGHDKREVGWGKIPEDISDVISTPAGVARIIYQGELKPGKYLRAPLPLEGIEIKGMVNIAATFCYASPIDPQDASCYTKAGLDSVFRPNDKKKKEKAKNANTKGFFSRKRFASEAELRSDTGKWETIMHDEVRMRGSSLSNPVFDIHYNAREGGAITRGAERIPYSLVITIDAPKHAELYNEILQIYGEILTPIRPQVILPVRV